MQSWQERLNATCDCQVIGEIKRVELSQETCEGVTDAKFHGTRPGLLSLVRGSSSLRNTLLFCLYEVAFYLAYRFAMSFSQTSASPCWFPDSILLCALLLSSPRKWW